MRQHDGSRVSITGRPVSHILVQHAAVLLSPMMMMMMKKKM
jgi:hypothetical protein